MAEDSLPAIPREDVLPESVSVRHVDGYQFYLQACSSVSRYSSQLPELDEHTAYRLTDCSSSSKDGSECRSIPILSWV